MDLDLPVLPPDLERLAVETAAEMYSEMIPNLLLVSRRVHEWIERFKYRTITSDGDLSTCPFRVFQRALRSNTKPAPFFRDRVQHLFVRDLDDTQLDEILSVCTEIRSLVLFQSAGPGVLAALGATRARRLNLDLKGLLQGIDAQSLHPMFTFVTHLDLFDSLHRGPHVAHLIDHLSLFPTLTHLAFFQGNREATQVFSRCRKLEALIGFYTLIPDPRHLRSIDDLRFVTMNVSDDDYVVEWVIGTRGGWDFWARADAFIKKRIKGEIEPSWRCWIKEGDGI
ncbi:hypothetical protein DFH08DRAFT_873757 [Mycena albidolilacea]|uniref:Uncharacterized protein n=1 Tax=Mycena albidolilacea TaxID=1033008 RepID=A0AAD6ZX80_9AGAR|nr:hypothetical protein DFH08DRAFT_873757 [Mycena albidolilacea]